MTINDQGLEERSTITCTGKVAVCRCWQSKKFPLCDGSHRKWNEEHQDQVGPAIVVLEDL